jgi:hypothetical protein
MLSLYRWRLPMTSSATSLRPLLPGAKSFPLGATGGEIRAPLLLATFRYNCGPGLNFFRVFGAITGRTLYVSLLPFETNRIRKCRGDISTQEPQRRE